MEVRTLPEALLARSVGTLGPRPECAMAEVMLQHRFARRNARAWALPGGRAELEAQHLEEVPSTTPASSSNAVVVDVDPSPGNRYCLAGSTSGGVRVVDLERSRGAADAAERHAASLCCVQFYYADGGAFASAGLDGTVKFWAARRCEVACQWHLGVKCYAAAMARTVAGPACVVACGCADGSLRFCDARSGGQTTVVEGGHRAAATAVAWSDACGHHLASGSADKTVRVWDLRRSGSTACLATLDRHAAPAERRDADDDGDALPWHSLGSVAATAHDAVVVHVGFCNRWLVTVGRNGDAQTWDAQTYANQRARFPRLRCDRHGYAAAPLGVAYAGADLAADQALAVLPHGRSVLAASLTDGAALWTCPDTLATVHACAFRAATQELVVGGSAGLIRLRPKRSFDAASFRPRNVGQDDDDDDDEDDEDLARLRRDVLRARRAALRDVDDQDRADRERAEVEATTTRGRRNRRRAAPTTPASRRSGERRPPYTTSTTTA